MLGLSGEHLWLYWGGVGMKVWERPRGEGGLGHKLLVLPCGLGGPGHKVRVLPRGLGGPVGLKSKGTRAPHGFGDGFWGLGGRGVNSHEQPSDSQIYGYVDIWISRLVECQGLIE
jgi:hypothetical protein